MGNGSGPGGLNSRIFTNSFAAQSSAMAYPFKNGGSFGGLTRAQYSYLTYHELADNSTGFGARGARWERANGIRTSFSPPAFILKR
jgi:hypothetical protein